MSSSSMTMDTILPISKVVFVEHLARRLEDAKTFKIINVRANSQKTHQQFKHILNAYISFLEHVEAILRCCDGRVIAFVGALAIPVLPSSQGTVFRWIWVHSLIECSVKQPLDDEDVGFFSADLKQFKNRCGMLRLDENMLLSLLSLKMSATSYEHELAERAAKNATVRLPVDDVDSLDAMYRKFEIMAKAAGMEYQPEADVQGPHTEKQKKGESAVTKAVVAEECSTQSGAEMANRTDPRDSSKHT